MEKIYGDGEKEEECGNIIPVNIPYGTMIILYKFPMGMLDNKPMEPILCGCKDLPKMLFWKINLLNSI